MKKYSDLLNETFQNVKMKCPLILKYQATV